MTVHDYLNSIQRRFASGISREHSYRSDLENYIRTLVPQINVTNEPANVTDCGNPDYVLTKGKIPVGYIEAKDIGKDLNGKQYKEQFNRYRNALENLIITDYIWFQFFQAGELVHEIRIAEIDNGKIRPLADNFRHFESLMKDFAIYVGQTIKSSKKLAKMMAGKAKLLQNTLENAVTSDEKSQANTSLIDQYNTFKNILIHDLKPGEFADIYAQTLAYGMFAARLHDTSLDDFSRQEAAELIPKSNPFLRKLFGYVAGPDIDNRIKTTVDNLADVFRATDVGALLNNFGKSTAQHDPMIHFYETFLAEYDKKLRKSRGVWYTPEPVVNFIVRAVDDILKTEFELPMGLADTSKTTIKTATDNLDKRHTKNYKTTTKEVHKVQILDPATGTGTFLAEVVKQIYETQFTAMQGAWQGYVEEHLIPRLNGFELLMASYAMAHLKLDMLLQETGYTPATDQRFNVYLTNSLEAHHPDTGTLFSTWLSQEANEANHIKRDTPVMCVIGNPPYSGESANKGEWIMGLMEDYKKEPGGKEKLNERNPKWINDDYVKFMRYGQHYIEKNGSGILAFINPHGFLDNPTFRGMRWHLLKTYDKIYTIDLHGNAKKKETAPDGGKDENVFDIMQGVSINLLIKTDQKKDEELGKVFHYDLYGKREHKYSFLFENDISSIPFTALPNRAPNYFMVNKDFEAMDVYKKGFAVNELFPVNTVGIVTSRDGFIIADNRQTLEQRIKAFFEFDKEYLLANYDLRENKSWKIQEVKKEVKEFNAGDITTINYRPFDEKFIYYNDKFIERSRTEVMQHFLKGENVGLMMCRQTAVDSWEHVGITNKIADDSRVSNRSKERGYICPLYLYPDETDKPDFFDEAGGEDLHRIPNLDPVITTEIANRLGLVMMPDHESEMVRGYGDHCDAFYTPLDLLDYIYAVLHSPTYRETYKEFLKIDFPRVPYPEDRTTFWQLVRLGSELRQIHLLEHPVVHDFITTYSQPGDNKITRRLTKSSIGYELTDEDQKTGRVWINDDQYFDQVPEVAWEFYIGGYQPAQKWLKDRRDRTLSYEDILHYQQIIVALSETDRLMKKIDIITI